MTRCRQDFDIAKRRRERPAAQRALREYENSKARATRLYELIQELDKELAALGVSLKGFQYAA